MEGNPLAAVEGEMEERGLSRLPLDVKELIFSNLSFESIYGAFNFLSSLPQQDPLLLFCGQEIDGNWFCVAYRLTQKWMTRPLSFLPNFEGDIATSRNSHFTITCVHIIQGRNKKPYFIAYSDSESFSSEREINMFEMVECNGVLFYCRLQNSR